MVCSQTLVSAEWTMSGLECLAHVHCASCALHVHLMCAHVRLTWWKCDLTDSAAMTRAKSVEVTGQIPFIATSLGRGDRRGVL